MRLEHALSMAYSKEENAIVERANKEVMRHLKAILFDDRIGEEWNIYVPLVQRILNPSIGVSPAQILLNRMN